MFEICCWTCQTVLKKGIIHGSTRHFTYNVRLLLGFFKKYLPPSLGPKFTYKEKKDFSEIVKY